MFSKFFIERPIFATVVSIIICIAGLVSIAVMPIEQYPAITPVQVTVSATYPGADSKTLADSVAAPIEAQINGVDNMLYMSSTSSSNGLLSLTVYFDLKTNPDIAQVQVQNRVNLALPQLPAAVTQQGVSVQKKSSSIMMIVAITSRDNRYSSNYIANYANVYVLDAIKRVPGAGQASVLGVPDQAMRIWMNPDRMASLGITTSDIQQAVSSQNSLFGAGQIGQQPTSGTGAVDISRCHPAPFYRSRAVRKHHPAGQPGRQRHRAPEGCGPGRGRAQPVCHRQQAERQSRHLHRRLPAARRQWPESVQGCSKGDGRDENGLSRRARLRDIARYDGFCAAVHQGSGAYAV